jgi:hypothetical protein
MKIIGLPAAALIYLTVAGCAAPGVIIADPGYSHPEHVKIPPGHMPPPGKCRIWHPDRPPGQQPPPGECHQLRYRVPPGAVLVGG